MSSQGPGRSSIKIIFDGGKDVNRRRGDGWIRAPKRRGDGRVRNRCGRTPPLPVGLHRVSDGMGRLFQWLSEWPRKSHLGRLHHGNHLQSHMADTGCCLRGTTTHLPISVANSYLRGWEVLHLDTTTVWSHHGNRRKVVKTECRSGEIAPLPALCRPGSVLLG